MPKLTTDSYLVGFKYKEPFGLQSCRSAKEHVYLLLLLLLLLLFYLITLRKGEHTAAHL